MEAQHLKMSTGVPRCDLETAVKGLEEGNTVGIDRDIKNLGAAVGVMEQPTMELPQGSKRSQSR